MWTRLGTELYETAFGWPPFLICPRTSVLYSRHSFYYRISIFSSHFFLVVVVVVVGLFFFFFFGLAVRILAPGFRAQKCSAVCWFTLASAHCAHPDLTVERGRCPSENTTVTFEHETEIETERQTWAHRSICRSRTITSGVCVSQAKSMAVARDGSRERNHHMLSSSLPPSQRFYPDDSFSDADDRFKGISLYLPVDPTLRKSRYHHLLT